VTTGN